MFKKIIAPIIIAVITIAAIVLYFGCIASLIDSLFVKIVIIVVLISLVGAMIAVTVSRIKEIKKEDIDDVVSKY